MGLLKTASDLSERTGVPLPAAKRFIASNQPAILALIQKGHVATDAAHAVFTQITGTIRKVPLKPLSVSSGTSASAKEGTAPVAPKPSKAPAAETKSHPAPAPAPKVPEAPKSIKTGSKTTVITPPKPADPK